MEETPATTESAVVSLKRIADSLERLELLVPISQQLGNINENLITICSLLDQFVQVYAKANFNDQYLDRLRGRIGS